MRRPAALLLLSALMGAASCASDGSSSGSSDDDLVVFAAASMTEAFTELGEAFEGSSEGVDVTFSFAASSDLARQISEGAPADVFASADLANMQRVTGSGAAAAAPEVFATNRAAILVESGNPLGIATVDDLADPDLVLVTCAAEVPCGHYASEVFANAGIEPVPDSLEQNVKSVVTKVSLGEADVGIVYATDVLAAGNSADGVDIPGEINVVAEYPIVVVGDTSTTATPTTPNTRAASFVDFVLGDAGQSILADHGFGPP